MAQWHCSNSLFIEHLHQFECIHSNWICSSYTFSGEADSDIQSIIALSIRNWGWTRAERYILDLHAAFETLATYPDMGADIGDLRPGYFRFVHDSHAVFYRKTGEGIFVVRVLHQRQEPKHYL